ncbi:hypothetical protein B0J11DRAFT_554628 [Dendryphion nanum]|uniref:GAT domain-containing protein n=1 Tax=Dendryphion nanum TaxID=256645 RepID=A0A9P9CZC0_9PLEO|nr:hypothetical protein B0J11DRAFT_554628 [Dendryphion nanum]
MLKKRFTSIMRKSTPDVDVSSDADTPEANVTRGVRLFCESGAANSGEEVLHLPTIVESAVASPVAAQAAAQQIRKFLSKENYSKPHVQYNAIMLIRILADNPGPSFTKHLDKQFADTVKHLLRNGQDPSVAQILKETLDSIEREKAYDTNLNALFAMWKKERAIMASAIKSFGPRQLNAPVWGPNMHQPQGFSNSSRSTRNLPPPVELAQRIEEARTSAKLLLQLVQSTPANELLGNDLVKEFSERCITAQRSVQGYINADNPAPDDDTMLTLIETNEQLSLAASKHQRAVLQARRLLGGSSPSPPIPASNNNSYNITPTNTNTYSTVSPIATNPTPSEYSLPPQPPPRTVEYPISPATDVGAPRNRSSTLDKTELPLPPSLQAGGNRRSHVPLPAAEADDPFADHHSSGYIAPPGPPPPRSVNDTERPNGFGYQPTPSYLGRQESSANNLTMHGGAAVPPTNEYERPRTPERSGHQHQGSDVSPVADGGPVTYRY